MSKYEYCCECGEATGRAGADEDSLYMEYGGAFCEKCYPAVEPPAAQPALKPLTDEQIAEMWSQYNPLHGIASFARAIEAAHGIKGEA